MNIFKATLDTRHQNGVIGTVTQFDNAVLEVQIVTDGQVGVAWDSPQFELLAMKRDANAVREVEQDKFTILSKEDHKVQIELKEQFLTCRGIVKMQLIIKEGNRLSTTLFYLSIGQSLDHDIVDSHRDVAVLDELETYIKQGFDDLAYQEQRMEAVEQSTNDLNDTMNANEAKRNKAETIRQEAFDTNEANRTRTFNSQVEEQRTAFSNAQTQRDESFNQSQQNMTQEFEASQRARDGEFGASQKSNQNTFSDNEEKRQQDFEIAEFKRQKNENNRLLEEERRRVEFDETIRSAKDAIEKAEELIPRQDNLEKTFERLIIDAGNSNSEIVSARVDNSTGQVYRTIGERLDRTNAQLSEKADEKDLQIERARIDSFTSLREGSTTGDAELIDARIGADGVTYDNLGTAIREQFKNVNNLTDNFRDMQIPFEKFKTEEFEWRLGRITGNGTIQYGTTDTYAGMVSSKIYNDFCVNIIEQEYTNFTILVAQYNTSDDSFVKNIINNSYVGGNIAKEDGKYHVIYIGTKGVSFTLATLVDKVNLEFESTELEYSIKLKPASITENEISSELLDKINNSTLEIATNDKIGGVKPIAKTPAMTQSVGIDADGRLFTLASSERGGNGYVNVCSFGAKGDGVTDDTIAIRLARDEAKNNGLPLYFPSGTYLIHGTIQLFSNMVVYGDGANTVIKKIQAVTQNLTQSASKGDTVLYVSDASKFNVGYDVYVGLSDWGNYADTVGVIKSIDTALNTVTIEAYHRHSADEVGLARAVTTNGVVSQTFPIFSTLKYDDCGENLFIEKLVCDGNKVSGEPESYQLSPIHIDPSVDIVNKTGLGLTIRDVIVRNSNADGISMQNMGRTSILNCIIEDAINKGIHPGFTTEGVSIIGCYIYNVKKGEGIFDCYSVGGMMVENCYIADCNIGVGGLEETSKGSVISNSVIKRCNQGVKTGASTYGASVTGCSFSECKQAIFNYVGGDVAITGCTFYNNLEGLVLQKAFRVNVTGNYFKDNGTPINSNYQPSKPTERGANNVIANNIITATASGKTAKIKIGYQDNTIVSGNILTGNSNVIEIDTTSTSNIVEVNNITG